MSFIKNLAYEASAGSGKTFMLVVRYLSLLFMGAKPNKILALTFTNKAANEMQSRTTSTLQNLQDSNELIEISKNTDISKDDLLKQKDKVLSTFLNSDIKIMTIDSFFAHILRKFSLYASLMPDFTTSSTQNNIKLQHSFLNHISTTNNKNNLIDFWIQSEKRFDNIFSMIDEFYTKKIEFKNMKFYKQDFRIYEKNALTLTKKLKDIVSNNPKASKTAKNSFRFESFKELCEKKWLERETLNYRVFSKCYEPIMDELLKQIKEQIKHYHNAKEKTFLYHLYNFTKIYESAKKTLYQNDGELGFDDITILVYKILNEINDSDFLYFRLDSEIEHVLLDEFQDTNTIQYQILKPIIDEITSKNEGSFFFVGDTKQSIYRFRGGNSALFAKVADEQNTQIKKLTINYRSQSNLVEFVNEIFSSKIKNYTPQTSNDKKNNGYIEVIQSNDIKNEVLKTTKYLIDKGVKPSDIAILCATNDDGESLREVLDSNDIEVLTQTTAKLINQPTIKAIIQYLKYLYFKEDIYRLNFYSLIKQQPKELFCFDIDAYDLDELVIQIAKKCNLFDGSMDILSFIENIAFYEDIEKFLFEFEQMDTKAPSVDSKGIKITTIHKSKGLEYPHVIIADRLKKPPPSKNTIIYKYNGIEIENIFIRTKGREFVDKEYATSLDTEKKLSYEDRLNALYVAFTRGKKSLFVITKEKDSMFDILGLSPLKKGYLDCKADKEIKREKENILQFDELYYGIQSNLLKHEDKKHEDLTSINFGIAMHYMLEMLEDFSLDSIDNAKNMMINKYGNILSKDEISKIEKRVKILLQSNDFLKLTNGDCYKEKALRYKENLLYIDLLIDNKEYYNIIDYKSSTSYKEKHILQVKNYTKAIQEITDKKAYGYICYLLDEKIIIEKVSKSFI